MDIVSACLVGEKCRYDGASCTDEKLKELYDEGKLYPVCPECMAGLPTPRTPMEIACGDGSDVLEGRAQVISKDGNDCTDQFIIGAKMTLDKAKEHGAKKAYLKAGSPSCGCSVIYDGSFTGKTKKGCGVTAAALVKNGIKIIEV